MQRLIGAQILDHRRGNRNHSIVVSLAFVNHQFVIVALDVVYGQVEAFGEAQATAIEQLDRRAVSAQANVP